MVFVVFFSLVFVLVVLVLLVFGLCFSVFEGGFMKMSPFECGFVPFVSSNSYFSMPFFSVSLVFLLFDVEIVILSFPTFWGLGFGFLFWLVVVLVLLVTLYEWGKGILDWV